jgi:hypothetical protein
MQSTVTAQMSPRIGRQYIGGRSCRLCSMFPMQAFHGKEFDDAAVIIDQINFSITI